MMVHKASSFTAFIVVSLSKWNSLTNHLTRHPSSSHSKITIFLAQNHLHDGPCHLIELLFSCNSPSRHSSTSRWGWVATFLQIISNDVHRWHVELLLSHRKSSMTFIVVSLSNCCFLANIYLYNIHRRLVDFYSFKIISTTVNVILLYYKIAVFLHRINSHDNHCRLIKSLLSCKSPHDFHQRLVEFYTPLNNQFELGLCSNPIQSPIWSFSIGHNKLPSRFILSAVSHTRQRPEHAQHT